MKKVLKTFVPWLITCFALYYAFKGVEWATLISHLRAASLTLVSLAACLTFCSYLLRARRWQFFFPKPMIEFGQAVLVLFLGFFMNNILPARAGEFVRAHSGARVTGETRTLVLATIASERLADGLTLSLFFVVFAVGLGKQNISQDLLYVAYLFAFVTLMIALVVLKREKLFGWIERCSEKMNHKASHYASNRIQVFLNGISPLYSKQKAPRLILWSLLIWSVELLVYILIARAFNSGLQLHHCILFLVTVNFSSLIPAAPGAIGVIEAVAAEVLQSLGVDRELALSMVITQHTMQYLVVGIPGVLILLRWKNTLEPAVQAAD